MINALDIGSSSINDLETVMKNVYLPLVETGEMRGVSSQRSDTESPSPAKSPTRRSSITSTPRALFHAVVHEVIQDNQAHGDVLQSMIKFMDQIEQVHTRTIVIIHRY